ncbi:class I SAM-dependent methyltransferase [Luteimonas saliphila]|uniref:class I SAM-dependent methyltransferase n=1 Tax=Luteimonas saliphila TaxID=2804919 RepID=UPI00192DBC1F|nr:class I SAM-dependent methyltransferase [Luteimonas saliphila]
MDRLNAKLRKAVRRTWMKYAMRGVGGADDYGRLDLAYRLGDPWNMESGLEQARFAATNALVARTFGRVGSLLEVGCGEGHQTLSLQQLADEVYGIDVSPTAIERARQRVPGAQFAATDIGHQPWGDQRARFDLVVACEVLYYIKDIPATLSRMSHLGSACLVTFFVPALVRVGPHLEGIPGLQKDWLHHAGETWLACWWRNP